nr:MAG TPA: hypothetical protein [Caudoviricetes sp.]
MMWGSMESSKEPNRKEHMMMTLGEAQDIFIDALPSDVEWTTQRFPGTPNDMDYVEEWVVRTEDGQLDGEVTWFDSIGFPVNVVIETCSETLHRDMVDPEDAESAAAWLTQN